LVSRASCHRTCHDRSTHWPCETSEDDENTTKVRAVHSPIPREAKVALPAIARGLAHQRPGAAASLREGLADTLTRSIAPT